jgi:hypothetical protein
MSNEKMQTKPYGIEDRKVKIEKIMTRKEKTDNDKKKGIGLYEKSTLQSKKLKNPKFYGYTNIKKY